MDAASLLKESWLNTQSLEDRLLDLRYELPLWERLSIQMDAQGTSDPIIWVMTTIIN